MLRGPEHREARQVGLARAGNVAGLEDFGGLLEGHELLLAELLTRLEVLRLLGAARNHVSEVLLVRLLAGGGVRKVALEAGRILLTRRLRLNLAALLRRSTLDLVLQILHHHL